MDYFWSGRVAEFMAIDPAALVERLLAEQARRFTTNQFEQIRAWDEQLRALREAFAAWPGSDRCRLVLEYSLVRVSGRIDALVISDRAIFVLEFKQSALGGADLRQVQDYALDLFYFHAASNAHPVVPVLVSGGARRAMETWPLPFTQVPEPLVCAPDELGVLLATLHASLPKPRQMLDSDAWEHAPYRPVPAIIDAACLLYARHAVENIAAARADVTNLGRTTDAILAGIRAAEAGGMRSILFVTGIPGAGKTLCGLNVVFGVGREIGAVFLTGNPSLVHVLREALARDYRRRVGRKPPAQEAEFGIQMLPRFRDGHAGSGTAPPEHVLVIDEAQRCWSREHAVRKTATRQVRLDDSEPAVLLDIAARVPGWSAIICLIGNGQEIHTGEGGLAEWGRALEMRPEWHVRAAPAIVAADGARQHLPASRVHLVADALHLDVAVRAIGKPQAASWVDALMRGDIAAASAIAACAGGVPFRITRDLPALRRGLRHSVRGSERAGLVASSGAARLRAEGLGAELAHTDELAVARWFLDRYPDDVRASDALEQVATEFSCQGLELDHVGMCWDADLVWRGEWAPRQFRGRDWQAIHNREARENQINTYRVLLTRARHTTLIWVPRGAAIDRTRDPALYDSIAETLLRAGATWLEDQPLAAAPIELDADLFLAG